MNNLGANVCNLKIEVKQDYQEDSDYENTLEDDTRCVENWNAHWIWGKQDKKPDTWMCFRKTLYLENIIGKAEAYIAVDSKYWLWVNDKLLVFEGGLNRGMKADSGYFDVVELKDHLIQGENTIAILVWYWGNEGRNSVDSGMGGLLFQAYICGNSVISDCSWMTMTHPAYVKTCEPYPSYLYAGHNIGFDARKDIPNWHLSDYDTRDWENARDNGIVLCKPWGRLVERPIPLIKNYGINKFTNLHFEEIGDKIVILAELPYACHITPCFKINSRVAGLKIDIRTDRYAVNGGPGDNANLYNGHRTEYITREGIQEFESLDWLFGEKVQYIISKGIEILEVSYRETGYDTEIVTSFSCSDDFFNKLYKKCLRTLYVCMRDNYMDCPDRERGQWIGDVSSQIPQTFYALDRKSDKLTIKAIKDFILWRDGKVLRGNVPGTSYAELPAQSLNAICEFGMIMSYWINSGDESVIHESYGAIKEYLELWSISQGGLVEARKGDYLWYDHGDFIDGDVLENTWYYSALQAVRKMAKITGNFSDISWYDVRIKSIFKNFNKKYWKGNGYSSGEFYDDRANALAVLSGLADKDKWPNILNILKNVKNSTPYMEGYVLEAMCRMDYVSQAMQRMRERYEFLVNNENTTLWEDFHILGTKNHAWSGGPLTILARYITGVDTEVTGYTTYHVLPQLVDLTSACIIVPSIRGNIVVKINRDKSTFHMYIESPPQTTAIVGIPKNTIGQNDSKITRIIQADFLLWENGILINKTQNVSFFGEDDKFLMFNVSEGTYNFIASYR